MIKTGTSNAGVLLASAGVISYNNTALKDVVAEQSPDPVHGCYKKSKKSFYACWETKHL